MPSQRNHCHPTVARPVGASRGIVTIDAMGCQRNYRPNHRQESRPRVGAQSQSGQAHEQVETWFELARVNDWAVVNYSYHKTVESHHHRTEIRQVWSVPEPLP